MQQLCNNKLILFGSTNMYVLKETYKIRTEDRVRVKRRTFHESYN